MNVFLVLACLSAGCRSITPPFERTLKIGPCEILSPYIFVAGVLLTSLLYHISPSTPERTLVVPLISARCRREGHPLPLPFAHAYKNFLPLVFPSHFKLPRVPRLGYLETTVWFIYLLNFLWAVQLRYKKRQREICWCFHSFFPFALSSDWERGCWLDMSGFKDLELDGFLGL